MKRAASDLPQAPKRALLYARVSGDDRKNATSSIESQLNDCRKYAAQQGYIIAGEFFEDPDRATSGADWLPELDKIIKLAPTGSFDTLVVREIDRLARNRFKQMSVEIELEAHGIVVEYVLGQFAHTPEGRLLKGLMSEFAEYEREKTRQRTHNGRLRSVDVGNITIGGSVAPYGFDLVTELDPKTQKGRRSLVINEYEASVVRTIYELYALKQHSIYMIRDYLDDHGVAKPGKGNAAKKLTTQKSWSIGTINNILDSEVYIGRWHYGKTRAVKDGKTGKRIVKDRPHEEWMMIAVPSIISEELYEAVQKRRELNKHQLGHQHKHFYTLGGMVRCGECSNGASGVTRTHKGGSYGYYKCNSRHVPSKHDLRCHSPLYKLREVDCAVWKWIKSLLMEPATLRQAIEDYQELQRARVEPQLSMLASTQARLADVEEKKGRLIHAYANGVLSLDELAGQKTALDKEIADLSQAVAILRTETEPILLLPEQIDSIEAMAAKVRKGAGLADHDREAQRALYQMLDVRVTLHYEGENQYAEVVCTLGATLRAVNFNASTGNDPHTILCGHLLFLSLFFWEFC